MQLGIFAKTFARPTVEECFDAVAAHGLSCVQFNMSCVGLPTLPDEIDPELCDRIASAAASRGLSIAAMSGTFNMIHPDEAMRADGLRRLAILAGACARLGTRLITLCTGTRDPIDMWRRHKENDTEAAWNDLLSSMRTALEIANSQEILLGIEPETGNVINSAAKAHRLIEDLGGLDSPLRVVFDPANLFPRGALEGMSEILDEASAQIGPFVAIAHAKDVAPYSATHPPAGQGVLDYQRFLSNLKRDRFDGPLILHGLSESEVAGSLQFIRSHMATIGLEETR